MLQTNLDKFRKHPRMADIFEGMRRWEEVRAKNWHYLKSSLSRAALREAFAAASLK